MGVRHRAVRERLQRKAAYDAGLREFDHAIGASKRVVDKAIAEGNTHMDREEFAKRLAVEMTASDASDEPAR